MSRQLASEFRKQLAAICSDFAVSKDHPFGGHVVLLRRRMPKGVSVFILLLLAPQQDSFTLELAWSLKDTFPAEMLCQLPFGNPKTGDSPDPPIDGEMRFRITEFWNPGRGEWWYVSGKAPDWRISAEELWEEVLHPPEYSTQQIRSAVTLAINAVKQYALPYFDEIDNRYGPPTDKGDDQVSK